MQPIDLKDIQQSQTTVLVFDYKSPADFPGYGKHEKLVNEVKRLQRHRHFRRVLSNMYEQPEDSFIATPKGNLLFASAEHYYQYLRLTHFASLEKNKKQAAIYRKKARKLAGNSSWGAKHPSRLKFLSRIKLSEELLKEWETVKDEMMMAVWSQKFMLGTMCSTVLLATGDSQLVHQDAKSKGKLQFTRWIGLEGLRQRMKNVKNYV